MCGYKFCISDKRIHSSLLSWRDRYFEKFKDQIQNVQNRSSGGKSNHIYETYKNTFMPHGHHIQRQRCVNIHSQIINYHTGNLYCDVVPNVQALIFLTRNQMISIPTPVLQLFFIFII